MSGRRWTKSNIEELENLCRLGASDSHIVETLSESFGVPVSLKSVKFHMDVLGYGTDIEDASSGFQEPDIDSYSESKTSKRWVITSTGSSEADHTELIEKAGVDPTKWEVFQTQSSSKDTAKNGRMYTLKLTLKPKIEKPQDRIDEFVAKIATVAPLFHEPAVMREDIQDPLMAVFSIYDAHFGKLAWEPETGSNYDLQIAEAVYSEAVDGLLGFTRGKFVRHIEFPVGNDLLHIDNTKNETTNGTTQDADGRLQKIFNVAAAAVIRAIGRMKQVFPAATIVVRHVPGNHDYLTSWFIVKYIEAYFKEYPGIEIDTAPNPRKYCEYGTNAIQFSHGREEKMSILQELFASEKPQMWGRTTCREAHIGHKHSKYELRSVDCEENLGFIVRRIPSLAQADAWHHLHGYVNNKRAAEVFLYSKEDGYRGHFSANIK